MQDISRRSFFGTAGAAGATAMAGAPSPAARQPEGGSAAEIPQLKRVSGGILIPEAESETLEKRVIERAVLRAACRAVGAPDDAAKAQQIFKSEPLQIEWPVFATALAYSLCDQAELFTNERLDRPDRLEYFTKKALELLKAVPDSKEVKSLKARAEKLLKKKR